MYSIHILVRPVRTSSLSQHNSSSAHPGPGPAVPLRRATGTVHITMAACSFGHDTYLKYTRDLLIYVTFLKDSRKEVLSILVFVFTWTVWKPSTKWCYPIPHVHSFQASQGAPREALSLARNASVTGVFGT